MLEAYMKEVSNLDIVKGNSLPLLLAIGLLAVTILNCNQLIGSTSETPIPSPTPRASDPTSSRPSPTATASPSKTPSHTSTPSRSLYANPTMGINLMYPSDWTIEDGDDFVAFTRSDGWAQISLGWHTFKEGQSTTIVADLLAGIRVEEVSEPLVVYIDHDGGDPVEVSVQGKDSAGVSWIYHFVVADSGDRALIIETVSTLEEQGSLKPIFEEMILSMEVIP
jgi:hypothetical protein